MSITIDASEAMYEACLANDEKKVYALAEQISDWIVNGACRRINGYKNLLYQAAKQMVDENHSDFWPLGIVFVGGQGNVKVLEKMFKRKEYKILDKYVILCWSATCYMGKIDAMEFLIKYFGGWNGEFWAYRGGHLKAIQSLIVEQVTSDNLMEACNYGHKHVLEHFADLSGDDEVEIHWHEALVNACIGYEECGCGYHLEFIKWIINKGQITNLTDVFIATRTAELVKFFVSLVRDNFRDPPLKIDHDQALVYLCEDVDADDEFVVGRFELIKLIITTSPVPLGPVAFDDGLHEMMDMLTDPEHVPLEIVKLMVSHGATTLGKYKKVMKNYLFHLHVEGFDLVAQGIDEDEIQEIAFRHGFIETTLAQMGIIPELCRLIILYY